MTEEPDFKGYIHDVGGPTANFRHPGLRKADDKGSLPATGSACSRSPAGICGRIIRIISHYCESCAHFRR